MEAEKVQQEKVSRTIRQMREGNGGMAQFIDNRSPSVVQTMMEQPVQRIGSDDEEEMLQGKFENAIQRDEEDEEALQGKFDGPAQCKTENRTGIPDAVKQRMEDSFGTDFSDVHVHPDSSKAPEVGALAYTQGTDIHFAPGQFKPETSAGQQLLGHELAHVVQQAEGRVQPTTEIGGMPVNDDAALEHEADVLGAKA